MYSIFLKEIRSFLSSLIAYITVIVFLLANGLFIWIFEETNLLDIGYADLSPFFGLAPAIFIFLISAITMRSFSDEIKAGTIETLTTKPVSDISIILGKYVANLVLVLFSILPTLIYVYTIYTLGDPAGNLDTGATMGSYLGLLFLGASYVAIGIFASSLTENQIVAFILSMFLCFCFYLMFDYLGNIRFLKSDYFFIEWFGINYHYRSISKGVIDSRDVVYFISLIAMFIWLTKLVFGSRKW
jgi:ABC-2 type transport system permease protein